MKILIKNGRVIDPKNDIDSIRDVLISDELISEISTGISKPVDKVIDAKNKIVCPGFIDLHAHLRTPGQEHKEDIFSGTASALTGGFTTVCAMANTNPVIDNVDLYQNITRQFKTNSSIDILQFCSITKKMEGKELVDVSSLLKSGCKGFSEDGKSVADSILMRQILELSEKENFLVLCHCEDPYFTGGVINEGEFSKKLNLSGIPQDVENMIISRELLICKKTGGHAHITHVSTKAGIELIRSAKNNGINVTCDVTPHHLSLNESKLLSGNTNYKMNPPLRTQSDVNGIILGIKQGIVDCIATDHAPHSIDEKKQPLDKAPFGVIGFETAFPVAYTFLVEPMYLNINRLVSLFTVNPAKILGIDAGHLSIGAKANVTIFDPETEIDIDEAFFKSKSKNSAFIGMRLKGIVSDTISKGKHLYSNRNIIAD